MSDYITPAEAAKKIRREIKAALGATGRQISVRSESYSLGSSINISIKVRGFTTAEVEAIAMKAQNVRKCPVSGDYLSGGNRFVFVDYCGDLTLPIYREAKRRILEGLPVAEGVEVRVAGGGEPGGGSTFEIYHDGAIANAHGPDSAAHQLTHLLLNNGLDFCPEAVDPWAEVIDLDTRRPVAPVAAPQPAAEAAPTVNGQADWLDYVGG